MVIHVTQLPLHSASSMFRQGIFRIVHLAPQPPYALQAHPGTQLYPRLSYLHGWCCQSGEVPCCQASRRTLLHVTEGTFAPVQRGGSALYSSAPPAQPSSKRCCSMSVIAFRPQVPTVGVLGERQERTLGLGHPRLTSPSPGPGSGPRGQLVQLQTSQARTQVERKQVQAGKET